MTNMRAKFQVASVEDFGAVQKVNFHAVAAKSYPPDGSDEDNTFAKWSPNASCSISISNPALHGKFKPGQKFYVDFAEAEAPA